MRCPGKGVELDCIDSRSLPSYFGQISYKIVTFNQKYRDFWKFIQITSIIYDPCMDFNQ